MPDGHPPGTPAVRAAYLHPRIETLPARIPPKAAGSTGRRSSRTSCPWTRPPDRSPGGQAGSPGVAAALQVGPDRVGQFGGLLRLAGLLCSLLIAGPATGLVTGLTISLTAGRSGGYGRSLPGEVAQDDGLLFERCHDGP